MLSSRGRRGDPHNDMLPYSPGVAVKLALEQQPMNSATNRLNEKALKAPH
jgi:hypothetical protein